MKQRLFSLLLTGAMLLSMCPPGLALEAEAGGLCPHHQEHSFEDCGYTEAVEGQPCGYVCSVCTVRAGNDLPMRIAGETGDFTVTGGVLNTDYSYESSTLTIKSSMGLKISGSGSPTTDKIVIQDGITANVTLENVNIDVSSTENACAFEVAGVAVCNLTLEGNSVLKSGRYRAGLEVKTLRSKTASLIITENSSGSLSATGASSNAGIGGPSGGGSCGNITINGGTVTATGGYYGAGIGGGQNGGGGTITINGGVVHATGLGSATGIGEGSDAFSGTTIKITGGTVTAEGAGKYPGLGGQKPNCQITITGGTVNAIGHDGGPYGNGCGISCTGDLTITGDALVYATAESQPAINNNTGSGWQGIVFEKNAGTVYGNVTLTEDLTIDNDQRLNIRGDSTLTIDNVELTNNGTITNNGTLTNNGVLTNNGTINGNGSYSGTGTVKKASQTTPGTGEGYTINYSDETIIPKDGYEVSSSNSGMESITGPIPGSMFYVRKAENNFYKASEWAPFTVTDRPAAPTGLQGQNTSFAGESDGKITGLDSSKNYQISSDGGTNWRDAALTGTEITSLAAGSYQVRVKAVENSTFASASAVVTVASGAQRTYTVTVNSGTGGGTYAEGAAVTITATVPSGQRFTGWTVNEGGVTLADASISTTTFTMPAQAVTVTANFENIPAPTYLATVNGGSGGGSYAAGDTVTITATIPSGQRFTGWTVNAGGVTLANASSATTTFTMPAGNVTVTANFQSNSGGGNYDGGGTYTPPTYPPTVERPGEGGGTPSTSPSNPKQGDTVTVTPKPDSGYEVDKITVTDRNGRPVTVTARPDGTYTFIQPGGRVTIKIEYAPVPLIDQPWTCPFSDVAVGDWYYEAVRFVQERGLMNGYSDGRFGPNDNLSRAQLAQILFNKEGRPVVNYLMDFSDVAGEAWYAEAVRWATSQGIVGGYGDGTFGPNDPITREQLAVMLWRYSGSPAATNKELHFNDADEISPFALEALRWAVENGILNGYGDGRLGPQGQATRAQVAQMLKNFIEDQENKNNT